VPHRTPPSATDDTTPLPSRRPHPFGWPLALLSLHRRLWSNGQACRRGHNGHTSPHATPTPLERPLMRETGRSLRPVFVRPLLMCMALVLVVTMPSAALACSLDGIASISVDGILAVRTTDTP